MTGTNRWKSVWQGKGADLQSVSQPGLEDLIRADGFDSGAGDHTPESWLAFSDEVYATLDLKADDCILEVGCGSGAFLLPAYQRGVRVSGVDYSQSLLDIAARAMPGGRFTRAEAAQLPLSSDNYDVALSHSVFQYFDSADYALQCVQEMLRVLAPVGARLGVLDVNDAARQDEFYRLRQEQLGAEDYADRYQDLPHRFYEKQWFREILEAAGFRVEIADQAIAGYGNSAFRFNVFAWSMA